MDNNSTIEPNLSPTLSDDAGLVLDCIKDVSILYDRNRQQYSIKIPKEVVEIFDIQRRDRFRFIVKIREGKAVAASFEVIKNARQ
ncbi:MAG: hypothetical protein ABIC95_03125 [archaeon]